MGFQMLAAWVGACLVGCGVVGWGEMRGGRMLVSI
jgi:hypothetical protein